MPPRTATEMAEWLRRLGDLATSELEGPMAAFLEELEADGRAVRMTLPNVREPVRWVSSDEITGYQLAFGLNPISEEESFSRGSENRGPAARAVLRTAAKRQRGKLSF